MHQHLTTHKIKETAHKLISSEVRSCVKVEVAVLGSSSLILLVVSVDVKPH